MSRQQYDAALAEAIRKYPAGADEGWMADFGALDLPNVMFGRVRMTRDSALLIEAHGKSISGGLSEPEVLQGLTRFWDEFVFRNDLEYHFLSVTAKAIVLEGFTVHAHHYVSIKVVVEMSTRATSDHLPNIP